MKVGTIITVYKGGKKDKRNPNSYRAITLSSYIYIKVLFRRIQYIYMFQSLYVIHKIRLECTR